MWISWYWVKLILECPDFVRPQRVGYLGSAHLNVCFWSHPGGSFGQSLGQVTAILRFFTAIQSLMAQIFILFFFLQHLVMSFFRKKAAEPAFMHLWAHNTPCGWFIRSTTAFCRLLEPLCKHALLCSTSWFQQKLCPELQGCDGFCLAPPPKFYGVPSSSVTTISLSS